MRFFFVEPYPEDALYGWAAANCLPHDGTHNAEGGGDVVMGPDGKEVTVPQARVCVCVCGGGGGGGDGWVGGWVGGAHSQKYSVEWLYRSTINFNLKKRHIS